MPTAGRATKMPMTVYRGVSPARKRGSKPDRARQFSISTPGMDLAAKLRLFHRMLRARVEHRDALVDIVRAVNTTLDPAKIGDLVIERAAKWIPAPSWAVVSFDASGKLAVVAQRAIAADMHASVRAVAGWVIDRGADFVAADLSRDVRVSEPMRGAVIAFPLVCRGARSGALVALDPQVSQREPRLPAGMLPAIRILLEPAAAAIDNATRFKRVEALSVTDELTQLYNSRYLNQSLRREAKRAVRNRQPLSLLFIDLDGFKGVNDTHGHLFGSRALVEAAAVIRGSGRETDVVARFGGDEFALVLPDTPIAGALAVAGRIRERIAAHHFLADEGVNYHLTVSIGVATLPDVADSADALLAAADRAMYQVKDAGKNGIQTAT